MMIEKLPTYKGQTKLGLPPLGLPTKVIYTVLAVICVVIGLIGLVVPIIPGILFIVGAIYLMSKVSNRVHAWSEQQTWLHDVRVRLIQIGSLRPLAKTRFVLLLAAKSLVGGLQNAIEFINRLVPKR